MSAFICCSVYSDDASQINRTSNCITYHRFIACHTQTSCHRTVAWYRTIEWYRLIERHANVCHGVIKCHRTIECHRSIEFHRISARGRSFAYRWQNNRVLHVFACHTKNSMKRNNKSFRNIVYLHEIASEPYDKYSSKYSSSSCRTKATAMRTQQFTSIVQVCGSTLKH